MRRNAGSSVSRPLPRVSIIVVNYGKGWLAKCLPSTRATEYSRPLETIIVDNASHDDLALIGRTFPEVKLVELAKNVGYANAVNIGFQEANGEYIAVLNNDVIVPPDWLNKLIGAMEADENVAAVCPKKRSLLMNKILDGCGGALNLLGQGWDRGESEVDVGQFSGPDEVTHPPGAIFLTKRKVIDEIGFVLNPDFFMLMEDVDFGLRCWKAGYKVIYTPNCTVYHARSPTLGGLNERTLYPYTKNLLATMFEIFDFSVFIRLFPIIAMTQTAQAFYLLSFHRKPHALPSVLRAIKDFLLNLRLYSRRKVRVGKLGDRSILDRFSTSLITFEEARRHERLIRLFLSVVNVYIKHILRAQPISDIIYLNKSPR